ncbi:MAG TPA: hypothetical protein VK761_07050 [Solirubrobacteraceae bacterium]|jgi:hypothetical protein|nr:hypothetical protein [Solirubrobacteraceae bacterium]
MLTRGGADVKEAALRPPKHAPTENLQMTLLILIGCAWLAVVTLFAALCRAAADGERPAASFDELRSVSIGPRLVLRSSPERPRPARRRSPAHRTAASSRQLTRRLRSSHGVR